jgi:glycosyltransferase involved in cell wall biosynthesis
MYQCTLIVPCYNESRRLRSADFLRFAERNGWCRLLFVDDGSSDDTAGVIEVLCGSRPEQVRALHLPHNAGKAEAVRQGVLTAIADQTPCVGYWDADLATPLDAAASMHELLANHPELHVVLGSRVKLLGRRIKRRTVRHYSGRVFATAASMVLGLGVYDTQCGAKLWRMSPAVASLFEKPFSSRWIFDVELLLRWRRWCEEQRIQVEQTIYEWPLDEWRDVPGSKLRWSDMIAAAADLTRLFVRDRLARKNARSPANATQTARATITSA